MQIKHIIYFIKLVDHFMFQLRNFPGIVHVALAITFWEVIFIIECVIQ